MSLWTGTGGIADTSVSNLWQDDSLVKPKLLIG